MELKILGFGILVGAIVSDILGDIGSIQQVVLAASVGLGLIITGCAQGIIRAIRASK